MSRWIHQLSCKTKTISVDIRTPHCGFCFAVKCFDKLTVKRIKTFLTFKRYKNADRSVKRPVNKDPNEIQARIVMQYFLRRFSHALHAHDENIEDRK